MRAHHSGLCTGYALAPLNDTEMYLVLTLSDDFKDVVKGHCPLCKESSRGLYKKSNTSVCHALSYFLILGPLVLLMTTTTRLLLALTLRFDSHLKSTMLINEREVSLNVSQWSWLRRFIFMQIHFSTLINALWSRTATCSSVGLHHSLVRLLRSACFARALCCAHSFAHSFTSLTPWLVGLKVLDGYFVFVFFYFGP